MSRIKRGIRAHKRRKKIIKQAKGFIHGRSKKYRAAKEALIHAGQYTYRDRKTRKREFKKLWNIRINAACRKQGISYSRFINGLKKAKVSINRKILAELAVNNPECFEKLINTAKESLKK
ncbi:MAG: 50S ribosomal protein L20 [Candidatus Omnitrophica bacterium]|nr:50S ribosomal protein L20 [Candidatus Omnitrophota bacterium]